MQMAQNLQNNIGAQVKRWYDAVAEEPLSQPDEGGDHLREEQEGTAQTGVQDTGTMQTNE